MENRLLARLAPDEMKRLEPHLEEVSLPVKQTIYEANAPIDHVYFPTRGVVSLVIIMEEGSTVEVGTIGNEGVTGTPVFLGADRSPTKVLAQIPVTAFRMTVDVFLDIVKANAEFESLIRRYVQAMIDQVSQSVACNHLHSIEERLCRWLLMCHDRVGASEFPLSQEFMAQMLGVRRPSVTIAAGMLHKAGLITYHRGRMTILDRRGLEQSACECYRVVSARYEKLVG